MVVAERKHTAAQVILMAADDLMAAGMTEFSEWDLTVAAWARDRTRFGLRGYAQSYPDHKRVMMEVMGNRAHSPIHLKLMDKVRPNYYRMTPLGRATAARLRADGSPKGPGKAVTVRDLSDTASALVGRPEFKRWQDNPAEPREWAAAAAFLGVGGRLDDPADKLDEVRHAVRAAIDWCNVQGAVYLTRGSGQGGTPVHVRELAELLDFLQALTYRFPNELEKKAGGRKPPKR